MDTLELRKVGRPKKQLAEAKKRLMFASATPNNKTKQQYLRRKKHQTTQVSKTMKCHDQWKAKLDNFLENNSRIMPNKRDTILPSNGSRVAKHDLFNTKYQTYAKFKAEKPHYKYKFSTFKKRIPKNIKRLKMSNRRVCVCLKDYNLEKK